MHRNEFVSRMPNWFLNRGGTRVESVFIAPSAVRSVEKEKQGTIGPGSGEAGAGIREKPAWQVRREETMARLDRKAVIK
jgi:hypothetical protein